jgi:Spy/CpxP family protein refolding chaperone
MKIRIAVSVACCALWLASIARAQTTPSQPPRPQRGGDIKTVLDLTDRQYNELNDVRDAYLAKMKELNQQVQELERQRRSMMKTAGADPVQIGAVTLQQQALQQQIQDETSAYRENSMRVLTAGQREKVEQIEEAVKLAPSARALMPYGLLDPQAVGARGFGGPGGMGIPPRQNQ